MLGLTATHLEVWDVRTAERVERVSFETASLSPYSRPMEALDHVHISHCMKVYKGKVFLLVRYSLLASSYLLTCLLGPF